MSEHATNIEGTDTQGRGENTLKGQEKENKGSEKTQEKKTQQSGSGSVAAE